MPTRRDVLAASSTLGAASLSGCSDLVSTAIHDCDSGEEFKLYEGERVLLGGFELEYFEDGRLKISSGGDTHEFGKEQNLEDVEGMLSDDDDVPELGIERGREVKETKLLYGLVALRGDEESYLSFNFNEATDYCKL